MRKVKKGFKDFIISLVLVPLFLIILILILWYVDGKQIREENLYCQNCGFEGSNHGACIKTFNNTVGTTTTIKVNIPRIGCPKVSDDEDHIVDEATCRWCRLQEGRIGTCSKEGNDGDFEVEGTA